MTETSPSPNEAAEMAELELVPGTPEYDQAMADKFDAHQKKAEAETERPGWLPEKFKSPEELAKAYDELQKKLGSGQREEATEAEPEGIAEARQVVTDAGVDFDALVDEYNEAGGFTQETYDALAAKGFPPSVVDAFIEGQQAIANQTRTQVTALVGGEESFAEMSKWAAQSLSATEIDAFNRVIDGGDLDQIKLAVTGLHARYQSVNGSEPKLLTATTGTPSAEVFRSTAELTAAMKDPRYKADPAYRADVIAKLDRSSIF